MKVIELYGYLDKKIPSSLSCEWDNDGLMCCPAPNDEIRSVLITLDVTSDAIEEAKRRDCNVIVSHHPLIFKGLSSLSPDACVSAKAIELIRSGISVFSFHTRLDAAEGGVNDILAKLLGLTNVTAFGADGEAIGRVGELEAPCSLKVFARLVKDTLGAPRVSYADAGKQVYRVAVLGGSGSDDIGAAAAAGADTYLSGELKYHNMTDAPEENMNLVEAGHFYTEFPVCRRLCELVSEANSEIPTHIFFSDRTKTV